MVTVTEIKHGVYKVHVIGMDWQLLADVARGYSIPITQSLAAVINKGIDVCVGMLKEADAHDKEAEDNETSHNGCTS